MSINILSAKDGLAKLRVSTSFELSGLSAPACATGFTRAGEFCTFAGLSGADMQSSDFAGTACKGGAHDHGVHDQEASGGLLLPRCGQQFPQLLDGT